MRQALRNNCLWELLHLDKFVQSRRLRLNIKLQVAGRHACSGNRFIAGAAKVGGTHLEIRSALESPATSVRNQVYYVTQGGQDQPLHRQTNGIRRSRHGKDDSAISNTGDSSREHGGRPDLVKAQHSK